MENISGGVPTNDLTQPGKSQEVLTNQTDFQLPQANKVKKGFNVWPVVVVLIFLTLAGGAVGWAVMNNKITFDKVEQKVETKIAVVGTDNEKTTRSTGFKKSTPEDETAVQPFESNEQVIRTDPKTGLEIFENDLGRYQVELPVGWSAMPCEEEAWDFKNVCLRDPYEEAVNYPINITFAPTDKEDSMSTEITNLDTVNNGAGKAMTGSFVYRKILYKVQLQIADGDDKGNEARIQALMRVATSLKVTNNNYSCDKPAYVPITEFPNDFVLSNYHESDGTDKVLSYWPKTIPERTEALDLANESKRGFMVTYEKDGTPETVTPKTVTLINPAADDMSEVGTRLWHYNCAKTQTSLPGADNVYELGKGKAGPFVLNVYGSSDNPKLLWGTEKWNVALLQKARSKVYVELNGKWQAYKATGYFATIQNGLVSQ